MTRVSRALAVWICLSVPWIVPTIAAADTIAGGGRHTVLVKPDGTVWTWGLNADGQLGDGTQTQRTLPTQVPGLTDVIAVSAGWNHTIALKSDGTVWAWGANDRNQLGDGTSTRRLSPVQVSGLSNIVEIAAGADHGVARDSSNTVWVWGYNSTGQMGNGTWSNASTAISIAAFSPATKVAGGIGHTLVIKTDGTVWGAGYNLNGQLGDNSTTFRNTPVQMSGITNAIDIAGGLEHSIILLSDGTVRACGWNWYGQIGDNTSSTRLTPVAVSGLTNVTSVSAGWIHSQARTSDGHVWTWGYNGEGEVGDNTTTWRYVPTAATTSTGLTKAVLLATGFNFSIAVDADEVVWTWGWNTNGMLGDGTTTTRLTPIAISGPDYAWSVSTPTLSVGTGTYNNNQTVVISTPTTGATIHYTLDGGDPTESDPSVASGGNVVIDQPRTLKVRAFKSGFAPSSTVTAVYTMVPATPSLSPGPSTYTSPPTVTISTATTGATIYYTTDGSTPSTSSAVYSAPLSIGTTTVLRAIAARANWPSSSVAGGTYQMNFGTLPLPALSHATGTYPSSVTLTITSIPGATIRYSTNGIPPNEFSTIYTAPLEIATTTTIIARAWHPDYQASQLSSGTYTIQVATPTFTPGSGTYAAGSTITVATATPGATIYYTISGAEPTTNDATIASGSTLVVGGFLLKAKAFKNGTVASATASATYAVTGTSTAPMIDGGSGHSAAIKPDGTVWLWGGLTTMPLMPFTVGLTGIIRVSDGDGHLLALRADGTVAARGFNGGGRLGDGTTIDRWTPVTVSGLTNVTAVSAGSTHSLARTADGTVWAWGANDAGQLGDGTETTRLTAVALTSPTNIVDVAAGDRFSVALASDGTVWTWGANWNSTLGDGTTTSRSTPAQVPGLTGVTAIVAGSSRVLALKSDGTVVAWGWNIGSSPVAVTGLTNVTAIAGSGAHHLALTSDGHVWSWGFNPSGQLGDGTDVAHQSPALVPGLTNIIQIGVGGSHSLAIDQDLVVWAWGDNFSSAVGDGTFTNRWTPTAISGPGMNWKVRTPALSVGAGTYATPQSVTVTCGEQDLLPTVHYTTTGVDPTESDPTVACGGAVSVNVNLTLKVRGFRTGAPPSEIPSATYVLKVVTPTLTPGSGRYATPQAITLSTATPGVTYRYTLDGSDPTDASTIYPGALTLSGAVTFRARAFKTGWTPSDLVQQSYWIDEGAVAAPVFTPAGGAFTNAPWVSLTSATAGATIRYTTDGSTPTLQSPIYRYAFVVPMTTTIKAQAFKPGFAPSTVTTATFAVDASGAVATPTITPAGGTYTTYQTVTITGPVGATLRYTTTGIDPTETDTTIASGSTITVDRSLPLKVRAWQTGLTASAVRRADYQITGALAGGGSHSLALKADGTVWAWGENGAGQVGDGTWTNRPTPVQLTTLSDVVAIAAGAAHSLAVKRNGTVWAWGINDRYQLGDGTVDWRNAPVQVSGLTNVVAVAAGAWHSLALKADGTVWAWGNGWNGQLGDNTGQPQSTPVQVLGLARVVRIAANDFASYALDGGGAGVGQLWAWGLNTTGQLGDTTLQSRYMPVQVPTGGPVVAISAAGEWAGAILQDDTVRLWGRNTEAELASGSALMFEPSPVASPLLPTAALLSLGGRQGFLLGRLDGHVWAWGLNNVGQTGAVSYPYSVATPHPLPRINGVTAAGPGGGHTLFADAKGELWVFGHNYVGQLGDGLTYENGWTYVVHKLTGFTLADNTWLAGDQDGDGLPTWREFLLHTDPLVMDTNGNGIPDGAELNAGRIADNPDADGDGLPNWAETQRGTDPFNADSDGDGVNDLLDLFPLDPTRSNLPPPDPNDHTPPVITLIEPTNATPVP